MPQPTCRHVHANGALCKSPPLRNRDYCHFHLDQIGRQLRAARSRARCQPVRLKLPLLEDPFAVQVALMQVADAIAHDEIDIQRGRLLMSLLRLASRNLKTAREWTQEPLFAADANADTSITEWPSFEKENELPADFDLSVDPEAAFPAVQDDTLPLHPTDGLNGAPEFELRAKIRQALGEAKQPARLVNADQVELLDIYEHEGEKAASKFAGQMARNDRRRERRLQRAHYEEVARHHNIKIAAKRLLEDQQRGVSAKAHAATSEVDAVGAAVDAGDLPRKQPGSEGVSPSSQPGSGTA